MSERWDIAVKLNLFRHLSEGGEPERIYREHIEKRNGGVERNGSGSWKRSVEDYVVAAGDLLRSMQARGFDQRTPIIRGRNGRLMDGAHRWACSLFLGIGPVIETAPKDGTATWGEDWFRQFMPNDAETIKRDWECLVQSL